MAAEEVFENGLELARGYNSPKVQDGRASNVIEDNEINVPG